MAKILIADDDPILVEILKFRLEEAGYSVFVALNGEEAIENAPEYRPDLVILDSMMPIMAGPEVLAKFKADAALKDIPIIMLTARNAASDIDASLAAGAAEYITKPFIPQDLLVRIEALVGEK